MLQLWSLVGRWHSQCGVSGDSDSKIDDPPLMCGAQQPPARPPMREALSPIPPLPLPRHSLPSQQTLTTTHNCLLQTVRSCW